ncbi:MAG TPA: hypothetical protein VN025_02160 [Candidatus Dormibacteraeota bacterium]|jgi:hypothetical protein|nr:hypothetical protein [Candidatus Dormibacteraeota bacterium]
MTPNLLFPPAIRHFFRLVCILSFLSAGTSSAQAPDSSPAPLDKKTTAEFAAAADDVLQQMSQITGLKLRVPLKKTLRSRDDIRAYLIRQMNDDKNPRERYADTRAAEAFGLLPPNFDIDPFMIDLMTEQIAGLYDPKSHEFYIADWIPLVQQKPVMAHELTHALEDQYFHIEEWVKAVHANGDATLARDAVLEGSAMAAMFDYMLQGTGHTLKDLPDFDPSMLMGDLADSPKLQKAPPFIKDTLLFPYMSGFRFNLSAMKPAGWSSLSSIFNKPPLSTQQILHPELYKAGKVPRIVSVPNFEKPLGPDWVKLEDDTLGEFGWREVLKQFIDTKRAVSLAENWEGDHYIVYEHKETKKLVLATRISLASEEAAARFLGQYSEALEKKYAERQHLLRRPDFFSFETPNGGVFLRCAGTDCIVLEGTNRGVFAHWNSELKWPPLPEQPQKPESDPTKIALRSPSNVLAGPAIVH